MKNSQQSNSCQICRKKRKLTSYANSEVCTGCIAISELIQTDPAALERLLRLAGKKTPADENEPQAAPELPDVLDGVRYRTTDREQNKWYVSVSELEGNPVEIFASTAFENDHHLQSRISNLTTITRLISLILRHVFMGEQLTLEKTLTQLSRSSRQPNDLPEMLGRILSNYKNGTGRETTEEPITP
jgi:hypothetical protein